MHSNVVIYLIAVSAYDLIWRPRQNGRHFPDDSFKWIFLNENVWILLRISLKFIPKGPINKIPALVSIMAWRRPGDKPLSEPMMVSLPTHICVTRPQWVIKHEYLVTWFYIVPTQWFDTDGWNPSSCKTSAYSFNIVNITGAGGHQQPLYLLSLTLLIRPPHIMG